MFFLKIRSHISGEVTTTNLNQNWEVFNNEFAPVIIEIFLSLYMDVINTVIKNYHYDQIFMP